MIDKTAAENCLFLTKLFVLILGLGVMFIITMYVVDRTQTTLPGPQFFCAGPFSLPFEKLGEFFSNFYSPWTERSRLSIELSAAGFIEPPRDRTQR